MRRFLARLRNLLRPHAAEDEVARELAAHLGQLEDEFLGKGLSPEEARNAACRAFGSVEHTKELHREARRFLTLEEFLKDLRYGARCLLQTPGFTAVAVLTLALGIGANTALFSVVNSVLLRPLAYHDADGLVTLLHRGTAPVAPANYADWRAQSHSFEDMAAAESWSPSLTGIDVPERVRGHRMTRNLLPLLGVSPMLGRWFLPGDDRVASDEVIISHGLWQRRFAGHADALGQTIQLNGEVYSVVGVMPPEFAFSPFWAPNGEVWTPMGFGDRTLSRGGNSLRVFARLKPNVTLEEARSDIAAISSRLEEQFPGSNRNVVVTPLKENVVGNVETPLRILLIAVGFVLLIACSNVSHMLLTRISGRHREIAVRTALGAGRLRLIAQFLTESLLLSLLGGAAGLGLAYAATRALVVLSPARLPRVEAITIDTTVVWFLIGITGLTTLLFGLIPAIQATFGELNDVLKEGGRGGGDSVRRGRSRNLLVTSQFTFALILLIGAGLTARSFLALHNIDPGFDPKNVLSMVVSVNGTAEAEPGRRAAFYRDLLTEVRALPGVESASGINHLPLAGDLWGWNFEIEGRPKPRPGEAPEAAYRVAMPGYFETMRLPIVRGRGIGELDDSRAPRVAVINERAAELWWSGDDPLGKRIAFENDANGNPVWITIVGICRDAKQLDWAARPGSEVYRAALQYPEFLSSPQPHMAYLTLVIRTRGNASELARSVQQTVWALDRNLPISQVLTMEDAVATATSQPRFELFLFSMFAAVAMALAAAGIYGVMSFAVSRRTHEIGIRMALGARWQEVMWMIARQGLVQAGAGTAIGLVVALAVSRALAGMLYSVQPRDPITFGVAVLLLILVALLASGVPAFRATRIRPGIALRTE
ncbi:MAG: ABC transporter permease [Bryobacterales bacterium]|nr:ABC transporter permease [Bryobacterales bacterium]